MLIKARTDQRTDTGMIVEKEIIGTAKKLQKKPADWNDLDMATVKNLTKSLAKPLQAHICDLPLQTRIFPNRMKTVTLISIF